MEKKRNPKTFILSIAKHFPADHPRKGEPTNFKEKILAGEKIHTIRGNYEYWKKVCDEVNAGNAIISLRQWSGKPYASPRDPEFLRLEKVGYEMIHISDGIVVIDNYNLTPLRGMTYEITVNDGLTVRDFIDWFKLEKKSLNDGIILHFTDFKY